ncbi:methyl-accepting chemotaxis protein signaling domain protein [Lasius niger]|uniref:Methyl-accepting chemotaxis protein signaling domain protein n=1 Tax=Lasius niger TaxID=67767 RepID=A0A0J7KWY2_LASNI|nr:methyl-accepting chemotaxis protein signaling domain protein [Lasius niger]
MQFDWDLLKDPDGGTQQMDNGRPSEESMDVDVVKPPTAPAAVVISGATKPGTGTEKQVNKYQEDQIDEINLQIKDPVRKKRELRREVELGRSEAGSAGPPSGGSTEDHYQEGRVFESNFGRI